jgi:hypothetical protein
MLSQEQNPVLLNNNWQFIELWIDTIIFPPRILMLIGDNEGKYQVYDPAQQYKSIFSSNNYDDVNSWLLEDEYERVDGKILANEFM